MRHKWSLALRLAGPLAVMVLGGGPALADGASPLFLVDSQFEDLRTTVHRIDPASGALTPLVDLGTDHTPVLGMAAASGRVLYLTGSDTSPADACQGQRSCVLMRLVLPAAPADPAELTVIGPVRTPSGVVTEIVGLNFDTDGMLYATSQASGGLYVVDPATGTARHVGTVDVEVHGGDVTFDAGRRLWLWTNIGAGSGLYQLDASTAAASAFELHANLDLAGLTALGHSNLLYGAHPPSDRLYEFDADTGFTGRTVLMTLDGGRFDHKRGDLDSPYCADDAACDDGIPCTEDVCTPGGCRRRVASACVLEEICPCDGPWRNHGEYVSCVARAGGQIRAGRRSLVSEAARSSCGRNGTDPGPSAAPRPRRLRR